MTRKKDEGQKTSSASRRAPTYHLTSDEGLDWSKKKAEKKAEKEAKKAAREQNPKPKPLPKKRSVDFCPVYTVTKLVYCVLCNKGSIQRSKIKWVQCPKCHEPIHRDCAMGPGTFCVCGDTLYVL
jgi:hypothetical protein